MWRKHVYQKTVSIEAKEISEDVLLVLVLKGFLMTEAVY